MKPVAIFRHHLTEGPGYFATFLTAHGVPWELISIDQGDVLPNDVHIFSGLGFMGGPMSVNDPLPWIAPLLQLIRDAVNQNVPVIGHCLGGQLLAKALGGQVTKNPVKEIGWGKISAIPGPAARVWLGDLQSFNGFHWHGETFSIPAGAERILASPICANQAYVLGKHLGMQCHVEMTEELILSWCESGAQELAEQTDTPSVQSISAIQAEMSNSLGPLHGVADRLYTQWLKGLI